MRFERLPALGRLSSVIWRHKEVIGGPRVRYLITNKVFRMPQESSSKRVSLFSIIPLTTDVSLYYR